MDNFHETAPSRSAVKRRAQQIEDLARQLLDVSEGETKRLGWDEVLRDAWRLARETRQHGARKRHTKHLAALLRRDEEATAAAEDFLAERNGRQQTQVKDFHQLEQLRDRLCNAESCAQALSETLGRFPAADAERLAESAQAFHQSGDRRAYREIFRLLRSAAEKGRP